MSSSLKAVKVSENVYWVGAIDWYVRSFHGYATNRGTTYNAFLVMDEKITLIDTVKAPFFEEMMERIRSVVDPERIDYIVSNHAEMDHSGSLPMAIAAIKPEKVYASPMGEKALSAHFGSLDLTVVKTGDTINLGRSNLAFVETKMLHWPDSMVSYLDSDKLLFSQDAFGMHLATMELDASKIDRSLLTVEAKKYFANILLLQAPKVLELLDALPGLKLDIQIVAPDHGPLWYGPEESSCILKLYRTMAEQKGRKKALVGFDTRWHSTEKMAVAIADGIHAAGVEEVEVLSLSVSDRSEVMLKLLDCGLVVVGSPTLNNNLFPSVADALVYMKGLRPQNLIGGAFGSFGWSGEGAKQVQAQLQEMGVALPFSPLAVKYVPTQEMLVKSFEFGEALGRELLK